MKGKVNEKLKVCKYTSGGIRSQDTCTLKIRRHRNTRLVKNINEPLYIMSQREIDLTI
jgi:hypothetical protein